MLTDTAMDTLVNTEDGRDLEVWRKLSWDADPQGRGFQRGRLGRIMNPNATGAFMIRL